MKTVTSTKEKIFISKIEYRKLLENALRYEYLRQIMGEDIFSPPPVRSGKAITNALKETGRYSRIFLESLKKGLERSSYFTS